MKDNIIKFTPKKKDFNFNNDDCLYLRQKFDNNFPDIIWSFIEERKLETFKTKVIWSELIRRYIKTLIPLINQVMENNELLSNEEIINIFKNEAIPFANKALDFHFNEVVNEVRSGAYDYDDSNKDEKSEPIWVKEIKEELEWKYVLNFLPT